MPYPVIDTDECLTCGACMEACQMDVLDIADAFAEVVEGESCTGCGACLDACPAGAITDIAEDD